MEEIFPWIAGMVIAAIAAGALIATTGAKHGIKAEVRKAELEAKKEYAKATDALEQRLKSVDERLATIEKALTDIP